MIGFRECCSDRAGKDAKNYPIAAVAPQPQQQVYIAQQQIYQPASNQDNSDPHLNVRVLRLEQQMDEIRQYINRNVLPIEHTNELISEVKYFKELATRNMEDTKVPSEQVSFAEHSNTNIDPAEVELVNETSMLKMEKEHAFPQIDDLRSALTNRCEQLEAHLVCLEENNMCHESPQLEPISAAPRGDNLLPLQPSERADDVAGKLAQLDSRIAKVESWDLDRHTSSKVAPQPELVETSSQSKANQEQGVEDEVPEKEINLVPGNSILSQSTLVIDMFPDWYSFSESMWDAALFVGVPALGVGASFVIVLALLLTVAVVIVFNGIIFTNFSGGDAYDETMIADLRKWRLEDAHLLKYADIMGISLASRVCNQDDSLIYSAGQVSIVGDLKEYLPGEDMWLFSGPLLCALALLVWYMTVLREALSLVQFTSAVVCMQKRHQAGHSQLIHEGDTFTFQSMSIGRALFAFFLILIRVGTLVVLLHSGSLYIVHTTSMQDLLLNCMALSLILDLDELVYSALAPAQMRTILNYVSPVKLASLPRFHGADLINAIAFVALISALFLVNTLTLQPFLEKLETAHDILCGGDTDFVVVFDGVTVGWVVPSSPYDAERDLREGIHLQGVEMAVHKEMDSALTQGQLIWGGYGGHYHPTSNVKEQYARLLASSQHSWFRELQKLPALLNAENREIYPIGYSHHADFNVDFETVSPRPAVTLLRFLLDDETATCENLYELDHATPPLESGISCYQTWAKDVQAVTRVQALCPHGCGCYSPWNGTIFKSSGGCPFSVVKSSDYQNSLADFPCDDPSNHADQTILSWLRVWMMNPEYQMLRRVHYQQNGLSLTTQPDPTSAEFCEEVYIILQNRETMAPAVCPIHFGCVDGIGPNISERNSWYCPNVCFTSKPAVKTTLKITNVDYNALVSNNLKMAAFEEQVKEGVVSKLNSDGYSSVSMDDVNVILLPGSVLVEITVRLPTGVSISNVASSLTVDQTNSSLDSLVLQKIQTIPDMSAIITGTPTATQTVAPDETVVAESTHHHHHHRRRRREHAESHANTTNTTHHHHHHHHRRRREHAESHANTTNTTNTTHHHHHHHHRRRREHAESHANTTNSTHHHHHHHDHHHRRRREHINSSSTTNHTATANSTHHLHHQTNISNTSKTSNTTNTTNHTIANTTHPHHHHHHHHHHRRRRE